MLLPDGIFYNHELDQVRTTRVNSFFSLIPEMTGNIGNKKSGNSIKFDKISALVSPAGFEPATASLEGRCSIQLS